MNNYELKLYHNNGADIHKTQVNNLLAYLDVPSDEEQSVQYNENHIAIQRELPWDFDLLHMAFSKYRMWKRGQTVYIGAKSYDCIFDVVKPQGYIFLDTSDHISNPFHSHMTWHYGSLDIEKRKDPVLTNINIVGQYKDKDVTCFIVEMGHHTTQLNKDTVLHITTACHNGYKPVDAGKRATVFYDGIKWFDVSVEITGTWKAKRFDTNDEIFIANPL